MPNVTEELVASQDRRIAQLEAQGRTRTLSLTESAELEKLLYLQYHRRRRLPGRIAEARAKLQRLLAEARAAGMKMEECA